MGSRLCMCSRSTFLSFSALLTMAVLCGLQADAQQQAAESDMRLGATAMQARHYEDAEHDFRKVVAAAPDYAEGHLNLGLALLREAQLPEAIASFEKAAQLDPKL